MLSSILKWPELGPKRGPREQRDCWKVSDAERMRWGTLLGQGPGDVGGGTHVRIHSKIQVWKTDLVQALGLIWT